MRNIILSSEERKIRDYIKQKLKNADIAHTFDHIEYVVNLAKKVL